MKTASTSSSKQRSTSNRSASLPKTSKRVKPTNEQESSERDRQRLTMGLRYEIEYSKQQEFSTPWSSFVS
jgi:hypothetical protein